MLEKLFALSKQHKSNRDRDRVPIFKIRKVILLKDLWREYGHTDYAVMSIPFELELKRIFNWTPEGYYFTDLGKIPVGGLLVCQF